MLNDLFGVIIYVSILQGFFQMDRFFNISLNLNQNLFGLGIGMYSFIEDKVGIQKQEMEVVESIVGVILGFGGKGIVEF